MKFEQNRADLKKKERKKVDIKWLWHTCLGKKNSHFTEMLSK